MSQVAKLLARILAKRLDKKVEALLKEDQFKFTKERATDMLLTRIESFQKER